MTPSQFRALRLCLNWSLSRVAKELGVNKSTVWRWENGKYPVPDRVAQRLMGTTKGADSSTTPPNY